ncbi:hypothetical protein K491DRAFT_780067 [Lophiostoma macrostomum CBS 122681]|uniref:F-box domain-containing protein n=1 Tax=Lophiostoma macrostomum CBS 122681 TaxID=1314788 RepID=A0A6A6T3Q0_9PLEO|nr:hypothetical protein K491DRAFT_780067 [Lophiostoma macrostomum CBS 122681]
MNDLAPEILSLIVGVFRTSVRPERIASYASISRKWQVAVEQCTFQAIKTNSSALREFSSMFAGHNVHRRSFLRELKLSFELPALAGKQGCNFRSAPDRDLDTLSFSEAVRSLTTILADIGSRAPPDVPHIHLAFLQEYRNSDCEHEHSDKVHEEIWARCKLYIIAQFDTLNVVPGVRKVTFGPPYRTNYLKGLSPNSSIKMMSLFPDLETLQLSFQDSYAWGSRRRVQYREEITSGLETLRNQNLHGLEFFVSHEPQGNETLQVPCLFIHCDPLISAMRSLALLPQLSKLHLTGCHVVGPTVFDELLQGNEGVMFPQLRDLLLEISFETLDGRRYFRNDLEYDAAPMDPREVHDSDTAHFAIYGEEPKIIGSSDYEYFLATPNGDTINPLLLGAARAARRFLGLQRMTLRMTSEDDGWDEQDCLQFRDFGFQYLKENAPVSSGFLTSFVEVPDEHLAIHQSRLYWRVLKWRPDQHIGDEWRRTLGPWGHIIYLQSTRQLAIL